jgi:hypothetical protein
MLIFLNASQIPRYGKSFTRLNLKQQKLVLTRWRKSGIRAKRTIILFLLSLLYVGYFDTKTTFEKSDLDWSCYLAMQRFYDN